MSEYVLELKGITKIFPGVKALNNVQFQLKPGEVHALMGENGAGKSTLIRAMPGDIPHPGDIVFCVFFEHGFLICLFRSSSSSFLQP